MWDGTSHAAGWVAAENQRPGTDAWRIKNSNKVGMIEGYAGTTSANIGDVVTLHVRTAAPTFIVEAYRMGYYGGTFGRLVWTSDSVSSIVQPDASFDRKTGMVEARWLPTTTVTIGPDWVPGDYLLKLTSSENHQSYIPLTVRDPATVAQLLLVNAVASWQAYNRWGGCSRYECRGRKGYFRSSKVSFDRPYRRSSGLGAGQFLENEMPMVAYVEELGLDTAYATSVDLDTTPEIARAVHGVLLLGHDEYYSWSMRKALVDARDAGVNLAFFGANEVYRRVKFEAAADGTPARVVADYPQPTSRPGAWRPWNAHSEWRQMGKPEHELVGVGYLCNRIKRSLVVRNAGHWIWAGSGVRNGTRLPALVAVEADGLTSRSPKNIDVVGLSPITCGKRKPKAAMTYYSTTSKAGVFAAGTIAWTNALWASQRSVPANIPYVRAATGNILRVFADGPAGLVHPSSGRR